MSLSPETIIGDLPEAVRSVAEQLRRLVRQAAPDLEEGVKWNAPSYALAGRDLVTLNFGKHGELRLILHRGARPPADPAATFSDRHGLAQWPSPDRGVVEIRPETDLNAGSPLADLICDWVAASR